MEKHHEVRHRSDTHLFPSALLYAKMMQSDYILSRCIYFDETAIHKEVSRYYNNCTELSSSSA